MGTSPGRSPQMENKMMSYENVYYVNCYRQVHPVEDNLSNHDNTCSSTYGMFPIRFV
jgi:hypothetical protein